MTLIATDGWRMVGDRGLYCGPSIVMSPVPKIRRKKNGIVGVCGLQYYMEKFLALWEEPVELEPLGQKTDEDFDGLVLLNNGTVLRYNIFGQFYHEYGTVACIGSSTAADMLTGAVLAGMDMVEAFTMLQEHCISFKGTDVLSLDNAPEA